MFISIAFGLIKSDQMKSILNIHKLYIVEHPVHALLRIICLQKKKRKEKSKTLQLLCVGLDLWFSNQTDFKQITIISVNNGKGKNDITIYEGMIYIYIYIDVQIKFFF